MIILMFHRAFHNVEYLRYTFNRNVLDGDLLYRCVEIYEYITDDHRYLWLDVVHQRELARMIGTSKEIIIDNLLEVELAMSFF